MQDGQHNQSKQARHSRIVDHGQRNQVNPQYKLDQEQLSNRQQQQQVARQQVDVKSDKVPPNLQKLIQQYQSRTQGNPGTQQIIIVQQAKSEKQQSANPTTQAINQMMSGGQAVTLSGLNASQLNSILQAYGVLGSYQNLKGSDSQGQQQQQQPQPANIIVVAPGSKESTQTQQPQQTVARQANDYNQQEMLNQIQNSQMFQQQKQQLQQAQINQLQAQINMMRNKRGAQQEDTSLLEKVLSAYKSDDSAKIQQQQQQFIQRNSVPLNFDPNQIQIKAVESNRKQSAYESGQKPKLKKAATDHNTAVKQEEKKVKPKITKQKTANIVQSDAKGRLKSSEIKVDTSASAQKGKPNKAFNSQFCGVKDNSPFLSVLDRAKDMEAGVLNSRQSNPSGGNSATQPISKKKNRTKSKIDIKQSEAVQSALAKKEKDKEKKVDEKPAVTVDKSEKKPIRDPQIIQQQISVSAKIQQQLIQEEARKAKERRKLKLEQEKVRQKELFEKNFDSSTLYINKQPPMTKSFITRHNAIIVYNDQRLVKLDINQTPCQGGAVPTTTPPPAKPLLITPEELQQFYRTKVSFNASVARQMEVCEEAPYLFKEDQHKIDPKEHSIQERKIKEALDAQVKKKKESRMQANLEKSPIVFPSQNIRESTIFFNSRFQSGNLREVEKLHEYEYNCYVNFDFNSSTFSQWFFFSVRNIGKGRSYKFNIMNLQKDESCFQIGMKPFVYSVKANRERNSNLWSRGCDNVCYYKNKLRTRARECAPDYEFDEEMIPCYEYEDEQYQMVSLNTLSFCYEFEHDNDIVFFAYFQPYTLSDLEDYLFQIPRQFDEEHLRQCYKREILCDTVGGRPCYVLTITDNIQEDDVDVNKKDESATNDDQDDHFARGEAMISGYQLAAKQGREFPADHHQKQTVFLTGRVHPGEANASFMVQGAIDFLLQEDNKEAKLLRETFIFKIIPMLNPDGVNEGHYRSNYVGADLNRRWPNPSKLLHPTIYYTKKLLRACHADNQVLLFCDFHGHTRKRNVFMYGCVSPQNEINQHKNNNLIRLIPYLLAQKNHLFSFNDCKFANEREKENTGRLTMFREFGILNSYTIESTFYSCYNPRIGCRRKVNVEDDQQVKVEELITIGSDFCELLTAIINSKILKRKFLTETTNPLGNLIPGQGGNPLTAYLIQQEQQKKADKLAAQNAASQNTNNVTGKDIETSLKAFMQGSSQPNNVNSIANSSFQGNWTEKKKAKKVLSDANILCQNMSVQKPNQGSKLAMSSKSPNTPAPAQISRKMANSQTSAKKKTEESDKRPSEKGSSDMVQLGAQELQAYINRLVQQVPHASSLNPQQIQEQVLKQLQVNEMNRGHVKLVNNNIGQAIKQRQVQSVDKVQRSIDVTNVKEFMSEKSELTEQTVVQPGLALNFNKSKGSQMPLMRNQSDVIEKADSIKVLPKQRLATEKERELGLDDKILEDLAENTPIFQDIGSFEDALKRTKNQQAVGQVSQRSIEQVDLQDSNVRNIIGEHGEVRKQRNKKSMIRNVGVHLVTNSSQGNIDLLQKTLQSQENKSGSSEPLTDGDMSSDLEQELKQDDNLLGSSKHSSQRMVRSEFRNIELDETSEKSLDLSLRQHRLSNSVDHGDIVNAQVLQNLQNQSQDESEQRQFGQEVSQQLSDNRSTFMNALAASQNLRGSMPRSVIGNSKVLANAGMGNQSMVTQNMIQQALTEQRISNTNQKAQTAQTFFGMREKNSKSSLSQVGLNTQSIKKKDINNPAGADLNSAIYQMTELHHAKIEKTRQIKSSNLQKRIQMSQQKNGPLEVYMNQHNLGSAEMNRPKSRSTVKSSGAMVHQMGLRPTSQGQSIPINKDSQFEQTNYFMERQQAALNQRRQIAEMQIQTLANTIANTRSSYQAAQQVGKIDNSPLIIPAKARQAADMQDQVLMDSPIKKPRVPHQHLSTSKVIKRKYTANQVMPADLEQQNNKEALQLQQMRFAGSQEFVDPKQPKSKYVVNQTRHSGLPTINPKPAAPKRVATTTQINQIQTQVHRSIGTLVGPAQQQKVMGQSPVQFKISATTSPSNKIQGILQSTANVDMMSNNIKMAIQENSSIPNLGDVHRSNMSPELIDQLNFQYNKSIKGRSTYNVLSTNEQMKGLTSIKQKKSDIFDFPGRQVIESHVMNSLSSRDVVNVQKSSQDEEEET